MDIPPKRTTGETLQDRLTENAYNRILPARYLKHDHAGNQVEEQEDLFKRVARNVAVAEAVWTEEDVTITPEEIKPDHPRREELIEEVFDYDQHHPPKDGLETELTEGNAKWVNYDRLVKRLETESWYNTLNLVESIADEFQEKMERLAFMPNSPCLMNAGDELQQLSACFVDSPDDDIDDIHQTAKEAAKVFQSGGGMGYAFWQLRPYGDSVGSTGGIASGPITFMRTYDQMCETIAQGGARRGAQMGVMRVSHPDIIQFIHAKNKDVSLAETLRLNDPDDYRHASFGEALEEARELIENGEVPDHLRNAAEGHLSNFNISVGITDGFMEAVQNGEEFTFTNPRTDEAHIATEETKQLYSWFDLGDHVEVGEPLSVPAEELWERIVAGAHENGEPGVVFLERINKDHSFDVEEHPDHRILATNPCGEQPLEEYEACNLGHINLSTVVDENAPDWREWSEDDPHDLEEQVEYFLAEAIDWDELYERATVGTRFLDNVVTMSAFPVDKIEEKVRNNRKIGLGIMGLAQMFVQMGVEYGTEEANEIARQVMKGINHRSKKASSELADMRGVFPNWSDSKYANPPKYADWVHRQTGETADEWGDGFPMRNHNTTTIAPTGTTSMVGNTSGGCEPIYNVIYRKNVSQDVQGDEMLAESDDYFLRVLEANGIDSEEVLAEADRQMRENEFGGIDTLDAVPNDLKELFVTTGDLSALQHASVQCALQEGVDSSISKTVNAPHEATIEDAREAFEYIYENGGKGVTYYRDGTRAKQVLTTRDDNQAVDEELTKIPCGCGDYEIHVSDDPESVDVVCPECGNHFGYGDAGTSAARPAQTPDRLRGTRYPIDTKYGQLSVKVFEGSDGTPAEVWTDLGKSGGFTNSLTEALGRTISIGLRSGIPPEEFVDQLSDISGPEVTWHKGERLQSIPDAVAWALEDHVNNEAERVTVAPLEEHDETMAAREEDNDTKAIVSSGASPECPDCGALDLHYSEGCKRCESCGWSEC